MDALPVESKDPHSVIVTLSGKFAALVYHHMIKGSGLGGRNVTQNSLSGLFNGNTTHVEIAG